MNENLIEKTVSSEIGYKGNFLTLKKDIALLPNGHEASREYIVHPGASAIVALTDDGNLILEKQYRYPIKAVTLEIPAGKRDGDEDPLICAKREFAEETGYEASSWTKIGAIATTVGFSDEVIHLYLAKGLVEGSQHTDEDEFINLVKIPFDEAVSMIYRGEISDAKTICAIMMAKEFFLK